MLRASPVSAPDVLQGSGFNAQLVRSAKRRTLTIQVKRGQVVVRAPLGMPPADIEGFVRQKTAWIIRHLQRQPSLPAQRSLNHGDLLPYFGRPQRLQIVPGNCGRIVKGDDALILEINSRRIDCTACVRGQACETCLQSRRKQLERWYANAASEFINDCLPEFARRLGVAPTRVKVRYYKARWGSCNHRGELQFNWLLAMAPPAVFEYVIVHELCHLQHFNHSRAFWRLVASVLPDYMEQRRWLQQQTSLNWF